MNETIDRSRIQPGCYAVIFTYLRGENLEGYAAMDEATIEAVRHQPGYLGYESVALNNRSIFISYWESLEAIEHWKADQLHRSAKGQAHRWYDQYHSMITRIEHSHVHAK
jgi:heme-degrading monooxygenase HmoA